MCHLAMPVSMIYFYSNFNKGFKFANVKAGIIIANRVFTEPQCFKKGNLMRKINRILITMRSIFLHRENNAIERKKFEQ